MDSLKVILGVEEVVSPVVFEVEIALASLCTGVEAIIIREGQ